MIKKAILAVLLVAFVVIPAFAGNQLNNATEASFTLTGGDLRIDDNGTNIFFDDVQLGAITFDVNKQYIPTATLCPDYTLTDYTGAAAGWHVTFKSTLLTNQRAGSGNNTFTLQYEQAATTTLMSDISGQPIDGTNGPKVENVSSWTDLENVNGLLTVNAMEGYGMGQYGLNIRPQDYRVIIDASNAKAGQYTGTFTATIIPGPGGFGAWSGQVE
jgi:hypothetical protein